VECGSNILAGAGVAEILSTVELVTQAPGVLRRSTWRRTSRRLFAGSSWATGFRTWRRRGGGKGPGEGRGNLAPPNQEPGLPSASILPRRSATPMESACCRR
jgi:hypothetical protein